MQTVISAFDDARTARRAVARLVSAGFPRDDVHVHGAHESARLSASPGRVGSAEHEHDRGVLASIGHVLASLFGADSPRGDAGNYTEAVRRGSCVVLVDAQDERQAERAADVLEQAGAIDMDERTNQWRAEGWARDDVAQVRARGGVRVIQRESGQPVREMAWVREERAFASDREASPRDAGSPPSSDRERQSRPSARTREDKET